MQRIISLALLALLVGGGWTYFQNAIPPGVRQAVQTAGTAIRQRAADAVQNTAPTSVGYTPQQPVAGSPGFAPAPQRNTPPTIRIASFNIQNFGTKKATKDYVMRAIAQVVRSFDVIAIQEIATSDDRFIENFLRTYVNQNGVYYDARVSKRVGRTTNTERYAFLFNTATIDVHPGFCSLVPDPNDYLHRPPYAALFRTRVMAPHTPFTFTLINTHTDPDEIPQELDALYGVYRQVQQSRVGQSTEDDVILLGDFNTKVPSASRYNRSRSARAISPRDLGMLARIPGVSPLIRREATNTRGTRLYDNLLIPSYTTVEFTGASGVMDLRTELGYTLDESQVLEISDHLPVWGEFSAIEGDAYRSAGR